jgi:hypothetical protein
MLPERASAGDRWYVTNGVVAVGPVDFDLLTRGMMHGQIPNGSLVRHESWKVWRPLEDIRSLSPAERDRTVEHFADISASVDARACSPASNPPPPPRREELHDLSCEQEETPSRQSLRPVAVDPVGVLANAQDLDEAFLLALSTAVKAAGATVGLVHRWRPDLDSVVTQYGHGPKTELLLGERLGADDATLAAARAGNTVMGEPQPGEAARYCAGRLGRCLGSNPRGIAMVPLHLFGKLLAMFELGRETRPFRACEIARVEDVVEALAERIVVTGWVE